MFRGEICDPYDCGDDRSDSGTEEEGGSHSLLPDIDAVFFWRLPGLGLSYVILITMSSVSLVAISAGLGQLIVVLRELKSLLVACWKMRTSFAFPDFVKSSISKLVTNSLIATS